MNTLISPNSTYRYLFQVPYSSISSVRNNNTNIVNVTRFHSTATTNLFSHSFVCATLFARATSDEVDTQTVTEELAEETNVEEKTNKENTSTFSAPIDKELKKAGSKFPLLGRS
ncbi:unnamed protein product [Sphenostylis stenocarpa]|uniref:Uncharacterized protein n=1 Tax=Sphenostylis stenocarpa TaxID=92480 RepID=A0AA86VWB7_9FABA|nr:unnamed protein product [Sphenostylis stenocarpa]